MKFSEFFSRATVSPTEPQGRLPYPYQAAFAEGNSLPELLNVPTGVGKTATAILGWLYRRRKQPETTPRRLVYCLPMRTLVEQTYKCAKDWLNNLGVAEQVGVHLLMGGADDSDWDEHPERDAILIGTQDMLLSRALNRGYGMSRYRWPMHFGLVNNDCLWVMDETQLMGVGLTTTAQLQGLRSKLGTYGIAHSIWMSATLDAKPITTVDHSEPASGFVRLALSEADRKHAPVKRRLGASKTLEKSKVILSNDGEKKGYAKDLAAEVRAAHRAGTLTLVVMNRVSRAQDLFRELQSLKKTKAKVEPLAAEIALIHSRFRPADRKEQESILFAESKAGAGRIVVATQAIEAGVDVSAATMFTELAPWSSLVQRFGRCNRGGEFSDARVIWIDATPKDDKDKIALPYDVAEFSKSRQFLSGLKDVGPGTLEAVRDEQPAPIVHTLRMKDLVELWDTTPDLAGNDLDISRFIRDANNIDTQIYWREWDRTEASGRPPNFEDKREQAEKFPEPGREELCTVSLTAIKTFLEKLANEKDVRRRFTAWRWNPRDTDWEQITSKSIKSGMLLVLHIEASGYHPEYGWTGDAQSGRVREFSTNFNIEQESYSDDDLGGSPEELSVHVRKVANQASLLRDAFEASPSDIPWEAILLAAWWHDVGKAHEAFQTAMHDSSLVATLDPTRNKLWAKSGSKIRPCYRVNGERRLGFRHELASALAWLKHHSNDVHANLIAYLIASHHGKVRLNLRSLPNETQPRALSRRFARGVWDGDSLPKVDIGNPGGDVCTPFELSLELMELGDSNAGSSWLSRVLELRDASSMGPFRLCFLEMLLRVADWRGSNV